MINTKFQIAVTTAERDGRYDLRVVHRGFNWTHNVLFVKLGGE